MNFPSSLGRPCLSHGPGYLRDLLEGPICQKTCDSYFVLVHTNGWSKVKVDIKKFTSLTSCLDGDGSICLAVLLLYISVSHYPQTISVFFKRWITLSRGWVAYTLKSMGIVCTSTEWSLKPKFRGVVREFLGFRVVELHVTLIQRNADSSLVAPVAVNALFGTLLFSFYYISSSLLLHVRENPRRLWLLSFPGTLPWNNRGIYPCVDWKRRQTYVKNNNVSQQRPSTA